MKIKAAGELKLNYSPESGIPCLFDDQGGSKQVSVLGFAKQAQH